ncbi:4-hydroxy-tetrahydrodipicolinate synthase [Herbaspirillum sp.]|uniref:4-hydroxy-tetrahydrodipicolinate synthase n=1 Tax=Herbaspirillum sp. TaxID=1890675 RepID=UPI001B0C0235|nr:4-hydroxy-tetrahydrodipicolinate synthase [Herbaspirillum sp.]MBO9538150.1 4-hydroxy-tetrahydrodipicolinate synthase [Herbaspirillum sp.]
MISASNLKGVMPAIPTPVNADDTVNVDAARALLRFLLKQGINGILPLGGTGEYGALSRAQRVRMVEATAGETNGSVPVIAGVLDPGYHDAIGSGRELAAAGADALLVLTPYYTNPTQIGIRDYFLRYADESPVPILIYEIPYRTRIAIAPEVLHELSRHERIIGMKACNTDMWHFLRTVAGVDDSFAVLSGEDTLFPLHMAAGARGGIIVTASLLPSAWQRIYRLAAEGKTAEAIAVHRSLIPLMNMAFAETNPGPMKAVMDLIGVNAPELLAPLVQPDAGLAARMREELQKQLGIFEFPKSA